MSKNVIKGLIYISIINMKKNILITILIAFATSVIFAVLFKLLGFDNFIVVGVASGTCAGTAAALTAIFLIKRKKTDN